MNVSIKTGVKRAVQASLEGGHRLLVDFSPESGGKNEGPRPLALLLTALGSCALSGVRHALEKQGVVLDQLDVHVEGTLLDCLPEALGRVFFHFIVEAEGLSEEGLGFILQDTVRACPMVASVRADIGYAFTLNERIVYPTAGEYRPAIIPEPKSCRDDLLAGIFSITEKE